MFIGLGGIVGSALMLDVSVMHALPNSTPFTEIRYESLTACMSFDFSIS